MYCRVCCSCILFILALTTSAVADLPNVLEEAETLEPGIMTLDFGVVFRDDPRDFGVADRENQIDFGRTRFSFGLGRVVELQVTGSAVSRIENNNGESTTNSGDWEFATKIWILPEKDARPGIGFYYSVKLPNGSNEDGGVTDETDFNTYFLFSKRFGERVMASVNLGLGILGDPFTNASQNDVFSYGLACDYKLSDRQYLSLNIGGDTGPEVADDPRGALVSFTQRIRQRWAAYVAVGVGDGNDSDDYRVHVGVRRKMKLFGAGERKRFFAW